MSSNQVLLIVVLLVAVDCRQNYVENGQTGHCKPAAKLELNTNQTELKRQRLKLKDTEALWLYVDQTTGLLLSVRSLPEEQSKQLSNSVGVLSIKLLYQARKGTTKMQGLGKQSAHPVLLSPGRLHVLSPEVVLHNNVQVPGILLVGAALQSTLHHLPLVDNEGVLQVENSLLPVCMPRPVTHSVMAFTRWTTNTSATDSIKASHMEVASRFYQRLMTLHCLTLFRRHFFIGAICRCIVHIHHFQKHHAPAFL